MSEHPKMKGPWGQTYNRLLAKGQDHGSAAYGGDRVEKRWAANCPVKGCRSTNCTRPLDCQSNCRRGQLAEAEQ